MIIFRPSEETQTVTIIPRYEADLVTLKLRDESKATEETFADLTAIYSYGYLTFEFTKTVSEGSTFELEVLDGVNVLFRGKAFATDETDLENYKINQ
jgi:2-keto-4-pentenoate hydratase